MRYFSFLKLPSGSCLELADVLSRIENGLMVLRYFMK
jgi:hypothetical protein